MHVICHSFNYFTLPHYVCKCKLKHNQSLETINICITVSYQNGLISRCWNQLCFNQSTLSIQKEHLKVEFSFSWRTQILPLEKLHNSISWKLRVSMWSICNYFYLQQHYIPDIANENSIFHRFTSLPISISPSEHALTHLTWCDMTTDIWTMTSNNLDRCRL